jgi:[ribosomal protein S5]-alanine N-acetyltransferase
VRTLAHPRCTLEPLVEAHAEALYEALADPAIYEFEGEPPPSVDQLRSGLRRAESRRTREGHAKLDWAVRLPGGALAGYVQVIVYPDGVAYIGYELASRFWRQGIGSAAVSCTIAELESSYAVHQVVAVLKAANFRSLGLLHKLGFEPGTQQDLARHGAEPDEVARVRPATGGRG